MNIEYVKIDDVNGEITMTVEEKDYADKVAAELKKVGKTHAEPGFRPGHVPAGIIAKKYGKAIKYDVINKEVGDAIFNYIKENKLHVLGNPVADKDNSIDIDAKDFTLKFKVGVAPEFDTKVNGDLHIPYYTIKVSDEMIKNQDDMFRRRFGKQEAGEEVDATALVKGAITELNEDGSVKENGVVMENGIVSPQHFTDEDQKKLFLGKKVGEEVVFNPWNTCNGNPTELSSMLNIDKADVDAHKGNFKMDIKEIIVLKPAEYNQEFFDSVLGKDKVKDEAGYKEALKAMIANSLTADSNYRFTIDAKNTIMKAIGDLTLPDEVLKDFLMTQNEALNNENINEEYVKIRPELEWELEKEAVASQLDIQVSEDDLLDSARLIARQQFAQYGMLNVPDENIDQFAKDILKDEKSRRQLYNQTADMKLFNGIRATVTVDNKEVDVEEFNKLFTAETPAAE